MERIPQKNNTGVFCFALGGISCRLGDNGGIEGVRFEAGVLQSVANECIIIPP